jgi:2-polyprenyl-6-methoxyphenol hydroxylase-like FAD-dependent oxidoreductase
MSGSTDCDVVQIGYGPVGQVMAALLGGDGHGVRVFERHEGLYGLPRAGHVDHEIMRIFQSIGAADRIAARSWPMTGYDILDRDGELLLALDWNHDGISAWHSDYLHYQPYLEDELDRAVRTHPNVEVAFGWEAVALAEHDEGIEVTLRERCGTRTQRVCARYAIGADGANSFVRRACGIEQTDLGFEADWLVMDVRPHDADMHIDMPAAGQICDPARPISLFRWLGLEHCRWEFMLLPGETREEMENEDACWRLLARWGLHPGNADLVRHAVYTFRSLLADTFQRSRAFLVGDAAHLMPPFQGQGMCSGVRDAKTLSWKLDLVLCGQADPVLLDSYTLERKPHAEAFIRASMALGEIVCTLDPVAAAARDEVFRSGNAPPPEPFPGLTDGVVLRGSQHAGELAIQGRLPEGRFDDVVGQGWVVLSTVGDPRSVLGAEQRETLCRLGAHVVELDDPDHSAWLRDLGAEAVIVRPDYYLFGIAERLADLSVLVDALADRVPAPRRLVAA